MGTDPVLNIKHKEDFMEDTVFVVAGGDSLKSFDFGLLDGKDTIVVNKAAGFIKDPTYFITMDYSFLRKDSATLSNISAHATRVFVAALDVDHLQYQNGYFIDIRSHMVYDLQQFDVIIKSYKKSGLGRIWKDFRTGWNSGFCAMQFGVLLGYKRVALLGIDLNKTNVTHFHGGYGESPEKFHEKLDGYFYAFEQALSPAPKGVEIVNCSKESRLTGVIGYTDVKELL